MLSCPEVECEDRLGQNKNNLQREPNPKEVSSFCLLHSRMSQHSSDVLTVPRVMNDLVGAVRQRSKDSGLHPNNSRSSWNRKGILQIGKEFCKETHMRFKEVLGIST